MEITILSWRNWVVLTVDAGAGRQSWLIEREAAPPPRAEEPVKAKAAADPWADLLRSILGDD